MERRKLSQIGKIRSLRAEAGLLTAAGAIMLGLGLPIVMVLALISVSPGSGVSPWLPPLAGGPLILVGYGICTYAAKRLAEAKKLESGEHAAPQKKQAKSMKPGRRVAS